MCDAHNMEIFSDGTFDYVYASHVLEHLNQPIDAIKNWYRICKNNGYVIVSVPSWYRYEKKQNLPSKWNQDHKRFYNCTLLLYEIEKALTPNSFLIEYVKDCASEYDWNIGPDEHSAGEYQIECIIKKIKKPTWKIT
jgi:predicted SAM-dependent methyltransferase